MSETAQISVDALTKRFGSVTAVTEACRSRRVRSWACLAPMGPARPPERDAHIPTA